MRRFFHYAVLTVLAASLCCCGKEKLDSVPMEVRILPSPWTVNPNDTCYFTATADYGDETYVDVSSTVSTIWECSQNMKSLGGGCFVATGAGEAWVSAKYVDRIAVCSERNSGKVAQQKKSYSVTPSDGWCSLVELPFLTFRALMSVGSDVTDISSVASWFCSDGMLNLGGGNFAFFEEGPVWVEYAYNGDTVRTEGRVIPSSSPMISMQLDPSVWQMQRGDEFDVKVSGLFNESDIVDLTNGTDFVCTDNLLHKGYGSFVARSIGEGNITALYDHNGEVFSGEASGTVVEEKDFKIILSPSSGWSANNGNKIRFLAYLEYQGESRVDVTNRVEWRGSQELVSLGKGIFQAVSSGNAYVTAVYSDGETVSATSNGVVTGRAVDSTSYSRIYVDSYGVEDIPASGGTVSEGIPSYHQYVTKYYTDGTTETDTVTTGAKYIFSGSVSAENLQSVLSDRTCRGYLSLKISLNGKSSQEQVPVFQQANRAETLAMSVSTSTLIIINGSNKANVSSSAHFTSGAVSDVNPVYSVSRTDFASVSNGVLTAKACGSFSGSQITVSAAFQGLRSSQKVVILPEIYSLSYDGRTTVLREHSYSYKIYARYRLQLGGSSYSQDATSDSNVTAVSEDPDIVNVDKERKIIYTYNKNGTGELNFSYTYPGMSTEAAKVSASIWVIF